MKSFLFNLFQKRETYYTTLFVTSGFFIFEYGELEVIEKLFGKIIHNRIVENLIIVSVIWFFARRAVKKHFTALETGIYSIGENLTKLTNTVSNLDRKLSFDVDILKERNREISDKHFDIEKRIENLENKIR